MGKTAAGATGKLAIASFFRTKQSPFKPEERTPEKANTRDSDETADKKTPPGQMKHPGVPADTVRRCSPIFPEEKQHEKVKEKEQTGPNATVESGTRTDEGKQIDAAACPDSQSRENDNTTTVTQQNETEEEARVVSTTSAVASSSGAAQMSREKVTLTYCNLALRSLTLVCSCWKK